MPACTRIPAYLFAILCLALACGSGPAAPETTPAIRRLPTSPTGGPTTETHALPIAPADTLTPESTATLVPTETPEPTATFEPVVIPETETPASEPTAIPPTEAPAPLPTDAPPAPQPGCECSADTVNCDDAGAVACFEQCQAAGAGDIHKLDRDDDGIACEGN